MINVTLTGDYSTDVKALLELLRDSAESLVVSCQLLESSESVVDRHHAKQNLERWTPIWCDLDRNRGREVQPASSHQVTCRHRLADARNKHIASGYFCVECGSAFAAADHAAPTAAAHGDEAVRKDATEAVMQRACAELPEDFYIEIHLENGSGYATLFNDGIVVDFGQDFESIGAQVEAALDAAMRAQGDGGSGDA